MDRYVIVRAGALEDLCQLAECSVAQLNSVQPHDPLNAALAGCIAEVRAHSALEPVAG